MHKCFSFRRVKEKSAVKSLIIKLGLKRREAYPPKKKNHPLDGLSLISSHIDCGFVFHHIIQWIKTVKIQR